MTELMQDFMDFSRQQILSRDCDPLYDVLRSLHSQMHLDLEHKIQHVLFYQAWYNLMSAQTAWVGSYHSDTIPSVTRVDASLPTGIERRGLRGGRNLLRHLEELRASGVPTFTEWLTKGLVNNPKINWSIVSDRLKQVWNNGRWAAYKGCELLQKVVGLNLLPPDMGHEGSSGPRKGLEMLYPNVCPHHEDQSSTAIATLNGISSLLLEVMQKEHTGVADLGEAETCLCDFHSLCHGGYYVGHDIDSLLEQVQQSAASSEVKNQIMEAREASLPHQYLGELGKPSWCGVDKERNKEYMYYGKILVRA